MSILLYEVYLLYFRIVFGPLVNWFWLQWDYWLLTCSKYYCFKITVVERLRKIRIQMQDAKTPSGISYPTTNSYMLHGGKRLGRDFNRVSLIYSNIWLSSMEHFSWCYIINELNSVSENRNHSVLWKIWNTFKYFSCWDLNLKVASEF